MGIHQMTPSQLLWIEHQEAALQQRLQMLAQSDNLGIAALYLATLETMPGALLREILLAEDPIMVLWQRLFSGSDAFYVTLLHILRLADGYAVWKDEQLAIAHADPAIALAHHIGRFAVLRAWWQCEQPLVVEEIVRRACMRYSISPEQQQIVLAEAQRIHTLLHAGWGAEQETAPEYLQRLAFHHRVRMLFVELAGLTVVAHLLSPGGLRRLPPHDLHLQWQTVEDSYTTLSDQGQRWDAYRWFARCIQQAYETEPEAVFSENATILQQDPYRMSIGDMINGAFFTTDADLARDQSNLHWSRNGLGRDEENSYFQASFTAGIFRCAQVMQTVLADHAARWILAGDEQSITIYDGATGGGAIAQRICDAVRAVSPERASAIKAQLTDISAGSLRAAWEHLHEGTAFLFSADLSEPVIHADDHGTFDVVGQNLGGHHLPDASYAAMIRGFVRLARPGGYIYLGDVDAAINVQLFNGLWANLYAVEWPRTSPDPYRMFPTPAMLAIPCHGIDLLAVHDEADLPTSEACYKLFIPLPAFAARFPEDIAFFTIGSGYVTIVTQSQLDQLADTTDWQPILDAPGSLSALFSQRTSARLARMGIA